MDAVTYPSVMVTGHRYMTAAQERFTRSELNRLTHKLAAGGTVEAISGMALGADMIWAESAVTAGLHLAAYIPCEQQPDKWTRQEKDAWQRLRDLAQREVVIGAAATPQVFHARNDAMLADADLVIAVLEPHRGNGGTVATYRKAVKARMPVVLVDLDSFTTTISDPNRKRRSR